MEAVNNLGHDMTIIPLHTASQQCDSAIRIYLLEQGEVKASGTYQQLTDTNQQFGAMSDSSFTFNKKSEN